MACNPFFTLSHMRLASPGLTGNRGLDLEHAVENMVEYSLGHIVIKGPDLKIDQGVDVISIDSRTGVLHFWEAKSWGKTVYRNDLKTFLNIWGELDPKQYHNKTVHGDPAQAEKYLEKRREAILGDSRSTGLLAQFPINSPVRKQIEDAIENNRMEFHLVGEAKKTKFSKELEEMALNSPSPNWY